MEGKLLSFIGGRPRKHVLRVLGPSKGPRRVVTVVSHGPQVGESLGPIGLPILGGPSLGLLHRLWGSISVSVPVTVASELWVLLAFYQLEAHPRLLGAKRLDKVDLELSLGMARPKELGNSILVSSFRVVTRGPLPSSFKDLRNGLGLILGLAEDNRLRFGSSGLPEMTDELLKNSRQIVLFAARLVNHVGR